MSTRIDRSLPFVAQCIAILAVCCLDCGNHIRKFAVYRHYSRENFSGRDLSGQSIALAPLLTARGAVSDDLLDRERQIAAIKKQRNDLKLLAPGDYEKMFTGNFGEEALDSMYGRLFRGEIIAIQNALTFWETVTSDYLMVVRLTMGFTARSADAPKERHIRFESELWECDSMEVVWRATVDGYCEGERESDDGCIQSAVCRIFQALPPVKPGYGRGAW